MTAVSRTGRPVDFPPMAEIAASAQLPLKTQAWRFIVTGGLSAVVDFGLYVLLCTWACR